MTPIDTAIARMKELEAKATPGKWTNPGPGPDGPGTCIFNGDYPSGDFILYPYDSYENAWGFTEDDIDFIAFARQFVPQIIAAYEELRRENEELRREADSAFSRGYERGNEDGKTTGRLRPL